MDYMHRKKLHFNWSQWLRRKKAVDLTRGNLDMWKSTKSDLKRKNTWQKAHEHVSLAQHFSTYGIGIRYPFHIFSGQTTHPNKIMTRFIQLIQLLGQDLIESSYTNHYHASSRIAIQMLPKWLPPLLDSQLLQSWPQKKFRQYFQSFSVSNSILKCWT